MTNNPLASTAATATKEFIAEPMWSKHVVGAGAMMVKTDSSGEAKVYYAFAAGYYASRLYHQPWFNVRAYGNGRFHCNSGNIG